MSGQGAGPSRGLGLTEVLPFGFVMYMVNCTQSGLIGVRDRPPLQQPGQGCSGHDTLHGPLSRLHWTPESRRRNTKGEGNHMDGRASEQHPAKAKAQEQANAGARGGGYRTPSVADPGRMTGGPRAR